MINFNTWKESGQYFQYRKKHSVFYQTAGTGPVLLLLHGFPTASWDWHKVWEPLSRKFCLLAFDFMGFGFSDKPRKYRYSIHDQADLAESLLRYLGIDAYHILAHDYGDTVAQELLARHYERQPTPGFTPQLLSLALLNGGIFPGTHHPRPIQRALASPLGLLLTPFLNKRKLHRNFKVIFGPDTQPTEQEIDEFYQLMENKKGKYLFHRLIRYMQERVTNEERWRAATVRGELPQCLINGAYDPISGQHVADYYQQIVNKPQVTLLQHIGHYPQTESPTAVVEAYLNFFNVSVSINSL
jgi:pimeloyl-ACP methyl ester carboxylesterase